MPHGHWKTTTFVGALTIRGFIAPWVLDGPNNRDAFETYVAKVLVPVLRPGDIVVMDNLSSHKGPRVREIIDAAGAELRYLPPYSPDFNPIENAKRSSKRCSERPPSEPSVAYGTPSAASSTCSRPPNAPTISARRDMVQLDRITLLEASGENRRGFVSIRHSTLAPKA